MPLHAALPAYHSHIASHRAAATLALHVASHRAAVTTKPAVLRQGEPTGIYCRDIAWDCRRVFGATVEAACSLAQPGVSHHIQVHLLLPWLLVHAFLCCIWKSAVPFMFLAAIDWSGNECPLLETLLRHLVPVWCLLLPVALMAIMSAMLPPLLVQLFDVPALCSICVNARPHKPSKPLPS